MKKTTDLKIQVTLWNLYTTSHMSYNYFTHTLESDEKAVTEA